MVATRRVKKYFLIFSLLPLLKIFLVWPLVVEFPFGSLGPTSSSYIPARILYVSIMSPLSLLKVRLGRPSRRSLSSYSSWLYPGICLVALLWTDSISSMSCFLYGIHAEFDTSRCGRTRLLYSCVKVLRSRWSMVLLMIYLTLLPCWIFRHHCAKAMLVAQPSLLKGLCPLGTSTSKSEWAQAKRAMSRRLLLSALLWDVYTGIWGSSGTVHRNLSSVCLNWSTEQPVVFLTSAGRALNNLWPRMARLASLSFCSQQGAFLDTLGMMHSLPLLG